VCDTGIGIASEQLEQIFEPFWQADSSQRTRGAGTGLGLSVVRRMVDMLRGTVAVNSVPGRGSTFTVAIPRDSRAV
jgi:two-component system, sensor histidine kinase and response regulator